MKTQTRVLISVAASLAVSGLILCIVFSILEDMKSEFDRGRIYEDIMNKTYGLNLLIAAHHEADSSRIRQIGHMRSSLENLLGVMTFLDAHEEFHIKQIRMNCKEVGYSLERLTLSSLEPGGGMETERSKVLVSHLWMKIQFISDDTRRLMEISQSRIAAAQKKAGISILALIVALVLINGAISFFSGRSIARMQERLEKQRKWLQVTLASIGDGVIAGDTESKIAFINPVAAALTGWPIQEALGRPVQDLLRIINEKTREPGEDIVSRVLAEGGKFALANDTVLVARDGRETPIEDSAAPIMDRGGRVAGVVLVFHDITEKRRAREALAESEERFRLFMDNSPTIAWVKDEQGRHVYISKAFEKRFRVQVEDLRGKTDAELWPADIAEVFRKSDSAVMAAGHAIEVMEETVNPDGSRSYWLSSKFPFYDAAGNRFVAGIGLDITERKRAEETLRRLSQFPEENPNPVLRVAPDGTTLYANAPGRNWLATLGWQGDGPLPSSVRRAVAEARGQDRAIETEITYPAGRTFSLSAVQPSGEDYVNLYAVDITNRKRAEERLRTSLGEKEVLLKEIHHRVKNNMQVISSLVALQADELQDPAMRDALLDVTHRIRSMAMVHEKLYQSAELARVEFAEYLRSLLNYLWRAHGSAASGIRMTLDLEPVLLPVNAAVPCGLILNELASNALKHAFRDGAGGEVTVSLRGGEQGRVSLCVRDNGAGLPAGFDWRGARTLGMRLVQMLAGQLHAEVKVSGDNGTAFTIAFEVPKA